MTRTLCSIAALSLSMAACMTDDAPIGPVEGLATTSSAATACSLPTPGTATIVAIVRDGRTTSYDALTAPERYRLGLVALHQSVYGDSDIKCTFLDTTNTITVVCSNIKTGASCLIDGLEISCDIPGHPTC
jgi:hypothetical protein